MASTPQDILNAAYAKSEKNMPGTIATESTELLQLVIRAMRGLYAFAARVNPMYFAEKAQVAVAAGAWPRPVTAESIWRVEGDATTVPVMAAGTEVVIVPVDDKQAESGKPAIYEFGQKFYSAGNATDPTGGNLTFFYSKRPTDPANLAATLDAMWIEQFNELLVLEVATYLALKDGRADEAAALKADRDRWAQLFIAFLEHSTANTRRRYGHIRRINTQTLVPLTSLLAGGGGLPGIGK